MSDTIHEAYDSAENMLLACLKRHNATNKVVIAFSGGLDSKSLLLAAHRLFKRGEIKQLRALHVDHGLQAVSSEWRKHCESDCKKLGICFSSTELKLAESLGSNVEAEARAARYEFFEAQLKQSEYLLFAHHESDQAETLLFRMLRGAGLAGAGAIPECRKLGAGFILRPWLTLDKQSIEHYAAKNNLDWIEDPSNAEDDYARNYLRNRVLPIIAKRWPSFAKSFTRFSQLAAEQSDLLDEFAAIDLAQIETSSNTLSLQKLERFSLSRQKNLIRYWANKHLESSPTQAETTELFNQLDAAAIQSIAIHFAGGMVRSYRAHLYLTEKHCLEKFEAKVWQNVEQPLALSNGVKIARLKEAFPNIRAPKSNEQASIRPRVGGEKCQPSFRAHSASLKKIFQELDVPPWQRDSVNILYFNEEIAAIENHFICRGFTDKC